MGGVRVDADGCLRDLLAALRLGYWVDSIQGAMNLARLVQGSEPPDLGELTVEERRTLLLTFCAGVPFVALGPRLQGIT